MDDDAEEHIVDLESRIEKALECLRKGTTDGGHHKMWVIDQAVRALTGCPMVDDQAIDCRGNPYQFQRQGENDAYHKFLREFADGEDGPHTYCWEIGIAP